MAKVNISLDAELVVEVMVPAGIGTHPERRRSGGTQLIARCHRTEAHTGLREQSLREVDVKPQEPQG
ncbi:DUF2191 domain-containing protein [Streptomyces sp. NPDC090054]|uniref:DUF2191 domain-containing protein n=1 Tax=Streptomyces sp. NPDC090054 TaxID=3365933 RepID=UPI00381517B6